MPPLRSLTTPNDFGPVTTTRTRITRGAGPATRIVVKGNPYSFTADWLTPCLPHLSLAGGRSPQSQAVRHNVLGNLGNDPGTVANSPASATGAATTPGTPPVASSPAPSGGGSVTPSSGPFAYVTASKTGHS